MEHVWERVKNALIVGLGSFFLLAVLVITPSLFGLLIPSLIGLGITYILTIYFTDKHLKATRGDFWLIPLLYISLTMFLATGFLWILFYFQISLDKTTSNSLLEYFYFSIVTMTSVGYGDLTPQNEAGQKISIAMALIGSGHMLVSVALFLDKVGTNTEYLNSTRKRVKLKGVKFRLSGRRRKWNGS